MLPLQDLQNAVTRALGAHKDVAICLFDTVDSTNSEAKRQATIESGTALYIARTQSGGRGRLGRDFHSPADTGLYMTLAYTTSRPLTEAVRTTALAAVATASAMEALTPKRPRIKWVNDLYLDGGKAAGILTEAVTLADGQTRMLVGIGINLTTTAFPDGLRAPAASLFTPDEASDIPADFAGTLAGEITRRLLALLKNETMPDGESCLDFYRRHLLYVGEQVTCTRGSETFTATVLGVTDAYALIVECENGMTVLESGEISIRPVAQ